MITYRLSHQSNKLFEMASNHAFDFLFLVKHLELNLCELLENLFKARTSYLGNQTRSLRCRIVRFMFDYLEKQTNSINITMTGAANGIVAGAGRSETGT